MVKNPATSMYFLPQVMSQSETFNSGKPDFRCIVNYIQWSVKISQENNFVELSLFFRKNRKRLMKDLTINPGDQ